MLFSYPPTFASCSKCLEHWSTNIRFPLPWRRKRPVLTFMSLFQSHGCGTISSNQLKQDVTVDEKVSFFLTKMRWKFYLNLTTQWWRPYRFSTVIENIHSVILWYTIYHLECTLDCLRCDLCIEGLTHVHLPWEPKRYDLNTSGRHLPKYERT